MKNKLFKYFGTPLQRVKNAILSLKKREGIILIDDEYRENEGDLIFASETMTLKQMAFTIRYGSGIVCLCINEKKRKQLKLPMMVKKNTSKYGTGFTITIEAAKNVTTGVSAQDRITTIRAAISKEAKPSDLNSPGHVFPLLAKEGGLKKRKGHTEATIELMNLAGFSPTGVLCELTNKDGSMARTPEIIKFAKIKKMKVLTIEDLIKYLNY
ncbi:3,4-dihydroxy-2-butanone 4-phosphate synthase [Buchnera aphidicola (Neophyllaphis podocarpi)]|uniref:3,4-dihydroxy-2-butanone-4-phosphate synthase n=1 Tax=Buchnera aphidicola TaxID=9 RepID=UPI0031B87551